MPVFAPSRRLACRLTTASHCKGLQAGLFNDRGDGRPRGTAAMADRRWRTLAWRRIGGASRGANLPASRRDAAATLIQRPLRALSSTRCAPSGRRRSRWRARRCRPCASCCLPRTGFRRAGRRLRNRDHRAAAHPIFDRLGWVDKGRKDAVRASTLGRMKEHRRAFGAVARTSAGCVVNGRRLEGGDAHSCIQACKWRHSLSQDDDKPPVILGSVKCRACGTASRGWRQSAVPRS